MRPTLLLAGLVGLAAPSFAGAQDHSHTGPGPHFIDAFFTENAYIERKIRPDLFVATADEGERYTLQVEVEWALVPNLSLITHVPFHHLSPAVGGGPPGLGDVSIGPKLAVINDRRRFILALGADLELPTGDADRGLGEEHAAAAPFLLAWIPFGGERRWLLQTSGHLDVPLAGDEDPHAEVSAALSWTSPLGLTPIVEGIAEFSTGGGPAAWAVAPQFRWEVAHHWEIGAAVRLPVSGPKEEDIRLAFGFIKHFHLPR